MEENTFHRVIRVEKEIGVSIAEERLRVDLWLQAVKTDLERQYLQEVEQLEKEAARKKVALENAARQKMEQIDREAVAEARRLASIDDEDLKALLRGHLRSILPGD